MACFGIAVNLYSYERASGAVATPFLSVARVGDVFALQRVVNALDGLVARGGDTPTHRVVFVGSTGTSSSPSAWEALRDSRERCSKLAQRSSLWGGTVVAMLAMSLLAWLILPKTPPYVESATFAIGTEYADG